jgi:hypothetical protein
MNKKIEELAHRAVAESGQEFWWLNNDLCIEKFAELIVAECVAIAHTNADVDETYDYACHTIAWKIQEHFGVDDE